MTGKEAAQFALNALGEAYRGDWSCVDGRSIQGELSLISSLIDSDKDVSEEYILNVFYIERDEYGFRWR